MNHKNLIIKLIQQDLIHNKLLRGLFRLGLDDRGVYELDIVTIISGLMGLSKDKITENWNEIYFDCMEEVCEIEDTELEKKLLAMASQCYKKLESLNYIEKNPT